MLYISIILTHSESRNSAVLEREQKALVSVHS
jgi:hypothetical protein